MEFERRRTALLWGNSFFYEFLFVMQSIGLFGIKALKDGLVYSESLTELNLSHCKLDDVAGHIVVTLLIDNEICEVRRVLLLINETFRMFSDSV